MFSSARFLIRPSVRSPRSVLSKRRLSSDLESPKAGSALTGLLAWYSSKLDTHPLITKCLTSGAVAGTGDFLCQWIIDASEGATVWDRARTGRFAFLGCAFVAPAIHFWYGALARRIPGTHATAIAKRVFMDQFVFTPFYLPLWLVSLWSLEELTEEPKLKGADTNDSSAPSADLKNAYPQRLVETLPDLMIANWSLWVPVMGLNFRFVPVKYQVLCSNLVALIWNMYLSFATSREK